MSNQFDDGDIVEHQNSDNLDNKSRSTHSHDLENEAIHLYRYHSIRINISQLLGAYHVSTLQRYAKNQSDENSSFIVDLYILPLIGIIGVLGNIGGILHFSKKLRLTYYSLLFSLATSDLVTILSFLLYFSLPNWIAHHKILENSAYTYIILYSYCILHVSQIIDIYLLISLSLERYFWICHPMKFRVKNASVFYYLVPIIVFSGCYCIPIFMSHRVITFDVEKFRKINETQEFMGNKTLYLIKHSDLKFNKYYQIVYEIICKVIVKCFVPYIVLIVSNVKIIRVFLKTKNLLRERKKSSRLDYQKQFEEDDELRIHTSTKGKFLRKTHFRLGWFNFIIASVFMLCYSCIFIWSIYDLWNLVASHMSKVLFIFHNTIILLLISL